MTFDILPYEIFQLVASILGSKKQDLAECCLVCTNWLPLFMEQLYLDITICGPPSFQRFYTCLLLPPSTRYTQHRQLLIHTLAIQDGNVNQDEMNKLPGVCPRLEQLTIDGRAQWDHSMPLLCNKKDGQQQQLNKNAATAPSTTTWWPFLKSACILATSITPTVMQNAPQLTRLTLRCMFDGRLSSHLLSALTCIPLLNYLSIDEFEASLQQLESIHDACTSLIELRLVHTILTDTNTDLALPSEINISASTTLRKFTMQEATILNDNDQLLSDWFTYVAQKYPGLESLEWWQKTGQGSANTPQVDLSVALHLVSQCRLLRSVRFFNINVDPLFYRSLLNQNQQSAPLHYQSSTSAVEEIGMNYSLDLGSNAQQLRSYFLWWNETESPLDYVPRLPSSLVNLHLSGRMCDGSFDINLILDHCPHLEFLHLDFGNLNQMAYQWKRQHPLKRLVMEEIKLSAHSIKSVAFRCRDLMELDLLDCILVDDDESGTNTMMVDGGDDDESNGGRNYGRFVFPFQRFAKVKLCGFRFASNPSLRAKSVGIYEMDKQQQLEQWYYLSHHATYLSYVPVHSHRYKLPVQAIKQYCITKSLPSIQTDTNLPQQRQKYHHLLAPPTTLNALRQMQRHYGRLGRDAPCAGFITLVCKSINTLYLENRRI